MSREDQAFLKRLLATFAAEANEHLGAMSRWLLALERAGSASAMPVAVEALFRETHSLKGAARSVDLHEVERLCHALESVFARLQASTLDLGPTAFDLLLRALDQLQRYLASEPEARSAQALEPSIAEVSALLVQAPTLQAAGTMDLAASRAKPETYPESPTEANAAALPVDASTGDTVRIASSRIDMLMTQVEELLGFKFNLAHVVGELRETRRTIGQWDRVRSAGVRTLRAPRAERESESACHAWREQHDADTQFLKTLDDKLQSVARDAESERRALAAMVDGLLDDIKQVLMLPTTTLFEWMPKLVRDLARDSGKQVALQISGDNLEIDRRVLDQIKAPLLHLLRNAVDHGIETPTERRLAGKPESGTISVDAAAQGNNTIRLSIRDDGRGADPAQLRQRAAMLGLISDEALAQMDDAATLALMFESGLSTSPILTDVSGRGLGLAIVRERVEQLGGRVGVERMQPCGIGFQLTLPTRLANFHGLLLKLSEQHFVMPSAQVERVLRVKPAEIKTVENRATLLLGGQIVPLIPLAAVLRLTMQGYPAASDEAPLTVMVVAGSGRRVAFVVDTVLGGQEVLVRKLGPQLRRVRHLAGATILGNGLVVPILNPVDLLKAAYLAPTPQATLETGAEATVAVRERSILVVEDSITTRALLQNILETAGYRVTCAVDGMDGLTALRSDTFDLVVSDVEMPRMDGYALTQRIRGDARLAELPVILVTALDSRDHKERGVEAGANAYIVKTSFDQSSLLDAIRRLL